MMIKTALTALALIAVAIVSPAAANATNLRSEPIERRMAAAEYMATMAGTSSPMCMIEAGYDYVGEDLTNVPGAAAEDCCDKCATTKGCKAFTWTTHNGGTCWLKKARGKIVINVAARSALVIPGKRETCQLKQDVDVVGNDIGNIKNVATAEACCDVCRKQLACRTFTWTPDNGGTCYWKSGRGQSIYKAGAVSGDVYPAFTYEASLFNAKEANMDYVGEDVASRKSGSADACFQICRETTKCGAFTWTNFNGGTCWLKGYRKTAVAKAGAVSGTIDGWYINADYGAEGDYVGNDIGNSRSGGIGVCSYTCSYFMDGCKAVVWTDYNGGTCWYKSAVGERVSKKGAFDFIVPSAN